MDEKKALRTVTRADIAREAGVTETIVSYVINGNRYVASDKRQRVEQAIATLKYRPNALARALKGKKLNHLLFVADDIQGDYFGKLISEIDNVAYDEAYFISLCADRMDEDFVDRIYSRFFDGIIIGSANFPLKNIQRLVNANIPIVLLEVRDYSSIAGVYGLINTGLYQGARNCVRALYGKGRRKVLYLDRISKDGSKSDRSDWRYRGFCDQSDEYGLPVGEEHIIAGCRNDGEVAAAIEQRIRRDGFVPDAIFGRNDYMALLGMETVKDLGYAIPGDMSVIGFDNSRLCRFSTPRLASMEIQQKEIARSIMRMMISLLDNRETHETRLEEHLETRLVMRASL